MFRRRASVNRSLAFTHREAPMPESSRVVIAVARVLRHFPLFLVAAVLVFSAFAVRDFLAERAHKAIELGQLAPRSAQSDVRR